MNRDLIYILASASPRRKELLNQIGIFPLILPADIDENTAITDPYELVASLSRKKGRHVAELIRQDNSYKNRAALVIAADTVVAKKEVILGKPSDEADAFSMLEMLSGSEHEVLTGVSLSLISSGMILRERHFVETTKVCVCDLTKEEIREYIATKEPMDKAGAYAIQGIFGKYISKIDGNYANVVGLPICSLYREMKGILHELQ